MCFQMTHYLLYYCSIKITTTMCKLDLSTKNKYHKQRSNRNDLLINPLTTWQTYCYGRHPRGDQGLPSFLIDKKYCKVQHDNLRLA